MIKSKKVTVQQAIEFISFHADIGRIDQSYLGKTGCACGCRGKYLDGNKGLLLRLGKAKAFEDACADITFYADGDAIASIMNDDKNMFVTIKAAHTDFDFLKEAV